MPQCADFSVIGKDRGNSRFCIFIKKFWLNRLGGQELCFGKCSLFGRIRGIIEEVRPTLTVGQEIYPFGVVVTVQVWP